MIRIQTFIVLLFLILTLSINGQASNQEIPADYGYIVNIGQQLSDIKMTLTDGSIVTTSDLKVKVVMLQFTASWCNICRREMPHIENVIRKKYKIRDDFALIGIDPDEPLETVKKFASGIKITYPMAMNPEGKIFNTFTKNGAGVTRNVIVDKDRKIVYLTGLIKEEEFNEMNVVIDSLLKTT